MYRSIKECEMLFSNTPEEQASTPEFVDRALKMGGEVLRRVFIPPQEVLDFYKAAGITYTIGGFLKI